ncbi:MAG: hypothetical protein R2771_02050 [Saprospiraceae bacterium]
MVPDIKVDLYKDTDINNPTDDELIIHLTDVMNSYALEIINIGQYYIVLTIPDTLILLTLIIWY